MRTYKITYSNGDYTYTRANGTPEDVRRYYLNRVFNKGTTSDLMVKCVSVEEVDG